MKKRAKTATTKKPKKTTKRKKTIGVGRPKKKTPRQRKESNLRAIARDRIRYIPDARQSRIAESTFIRTWIDPALLRVEPALQKSKWVEYRYMSELQCTELFAKQYIRSYRLAFEAYGDIELAMSKRPIDNEFVRNTLADMTSLFKARQLADELGMPYDLFLDTLMAGKVVNGKWKQPPMPNQLLCGNSTRARFRGRPNRDEITARLYTDDWDARFFTERSIDDPVQAAAVNEMRIDVLRASDKPARLAHYMDLPGVMSLQRARSLFPVALVDTAVALRAGRAIRIGGLPKADPYLPACIGNRKMAVVSPCHSCAWASECKSFRAAVTGTLIAAHGSGDPRADRRRRLGAERTRRSRDRARSERGSSPGDL